MGRLGAAGRKVYSSEAHLHNPDLRLQQHQRRHHGRTNRPRAGVECKRCRCELWAGRGACGLCGCHVPRVWASPPAGRTCGAPAAGRERRSDRGRRRRPTLDAPALPKLLQEWLASLELPENVLVAFKENAVAGEGGCGLEAAAGLQLGRCREHAAGASP